MRVISRDELFGILVIAIALIIAVGVGTAYYVFNHG